MFLTRSLLIRSSFTLARLYASIAWLKLRVDLLDLGEHALRPRLLLLDLRRLCSRSAGCREDRNQTEQER